MVRPVTECRAYTKTYQSLLKRRPDRIERIFYGAPKFIERMTRAHAMALEPFGWYRREALR